MNRNNPTPLSSTPIPSSRIAQWECSAMGAFSASQTSQNPPKIPPKFKSNTGSTYSPSNNNRQSDGCDMYFISPDALSHALPVSLQRGGGIQRPSKSSTAGSIRRLEGWKKTKAMRASNEYLIDEFPEGAVIIDTPANIDMKLFRKPLGTYLIHKGPTNTDNCPFTIHTIYGSKKTNTQKMIKIDILYNPEKSVYYADNLGSNFPSSCYPSLRSLVDGNRIIFKCENYER